MGRVGIHQLILWSLKGCKTAVHLNFKPVYRAERFQMGQTYLWCNGFYGIQIYPLPEEFSSASEERQNQLIREGLSKIVGRIQPGSEWGSGYTSVDGGQFYDIHDNENYDSRMEELERTVVDVLIKMGVSREYPYGVETPDENGVFIIHNDADAGDQIDSRDAILDQALRKMGYTKKD